jgi:oligopeptide transport system permease protein
VLSRITDTFFAIPLLLGAIVFLQAFPFRNIWTVVAAIMILGWPTVARIMRGAVISVKESDFVTAARALGASDMRILRRHILPNAIAPVIVVATISLGLFIVLEATLSFLGIGLPSSTVSWGSDINDAQSSLRSAPHVLLYPSVALSITVLAFMLLGDAVRDALDPKLR